MSYKVTTGMTYSSFLFLTGIFIILVGKYSNDLTLLLFNTFASFYLFHIICFLSIPLLLILFVVIMSRPSMSQTDLFTKYDDSVQEFFIIKLFKKYAVLLESLASFIVNLIILGSILFLLLLLLLDLVFGISAIFSLSRLDETLWKVLEVIGALIILNMLALSTLFIKNVVTLYNYMNFPLSSFKYVNFMGWFFKLHSLLRSDKHLADLTHSSLMMLQGDNVGFEHYWKKFEIGSIARIAVFEVIKFIVKTIYIITKPILILFKAKYLYYLLLPFVYFIGITINIVITFFFNIFRLIFLLLINYIYYANFLIWVSLSILMTVILFMINSIGISLFFTNEITFVTVFSNLLVFMLFNTVLVIFIYNILPEYKIYYSIFDIKENYFQNYKHLKSNKDKLLSFYINLLTFLSLVVALIYFVSYQGISLDQVVEFSNTFYESLKSSYTNYFLKLKNYF